MRTNHRPFLVLLAVVFSIIPILIAAPSFAQQSAKGKAAADATTALLQMNSHYQQTPAAQKAQLLTQFRGMASQRQQMMSSLIQSNPGDFLRVAVPSDIRGSMPAAIQSFVEQQIQAQGTLEILHADFGGSAKGLTGGKFYYHLKTASAVLTLHFSEKAPTHLLTGAVVRATGVRLGNDVALACCSGTNSSNLQTLSSVLPNTFGAQSTLVLLVNFQDNTTQPYTLNNAYDVVFNQTSNFDLENSLQQAWLTGNAVGWYTLPMSSSTCDYSSIASYANQAATAAGVNLSNYKHYVYAFPSISACGWWGLGTVGGSPSQAWINGSIAVKVVGHEMGHNLGLYHSHSSSCGTTQTLCSTPTTSEYGDSIDIMGSPGAGHFNAFQKERLGWLNYGISPPITTVQSNGTYSIGPYENQDSTTKALKILQAMDPTTGAKTWYYVEFRQPTGFDNFLSNDANVQNGVLVHTGTDSDANSSELLNMAPALGNFYTSALDVGQTFIDPNAGITLQTVSASPSGANVSVVFGTPTCAHFNPTVSISPYQSQTVQAGAAVLYTASVLNNDNAGCTSSTFNLGASVPSGWNTGYSTPTLTLSPGGSGSSTLQVISPNSAATGIYSVAASGTNSSATNFSGSASATYVLNTAPCINANPTVTLSPAQSQSVQPGTTVTYVIAVKNNDNASCNSSTFHLSDSVTSGWTAVLGMSNAALTIAPGSQASTSLNVTSPTNATGGSYSLTGSAVNTTYSSSNYSGSAGATYVVAGGASCTRANPSLTISPSQSQSVAAGTPVNFTVSVKNNDSSACTTSTFNLSDTVSSSWSGVWNSSTLTLSPGSTASATLQVGSPSTAGAGSYNLTASASNASAGSYSGSVSAAYVVATSTSTTVSVSTNSATYTGGQNVKISVSVLSGTTPVSGAAVKVNVINPLGTVTSLSGSTGTNGSLTLNYRLKKQATSGTYQVQASGGSTTSPSGLATTTFVVQ
jgi:uncharacterized membrane protein